MTQERIAWIFAAAFIGAGAAGFTPNPLVGPEGLFVTNAAHNLVHLVSGAAFAGAAVVGGRFVSRFMLAFGTVYLLVGALGFIMLGGAAQGRLLGLVHINTPDNFLHVGLGASILTAGLLPLIRPSMADVEAAS